MYLYRNRANKMNKSVRPLSGSLGAQICGVNLSEPLDEETAAFVDRVLYEHVVLVFPNQSLSPAAQVAFTEHFGAVAEHPLRTRRSAPGFPGVLILENKPGQPGARNDYWHSDISHAECPPALSLLHALAVPENRGDTLFCSMYAAYDALSDGLRETLEGLRAVHSGEVTAQRVRREKGTDALPIDRVPPPRSHPVVRHHPHSGRKALYVNPHFTLRFEGMTDAESAPLLAHIYKLATRPENIYRHRWAAGDLVVWDNRCAMHYAVCDYDDTKPRLMHRTTAAGEVPC